jgi:hypothetical protein
MESSTCTPTSSRIDSQVSSSPPVRFNENSLIAALYHTLPSTARYSPRSDRTMTRSMQGIEYQQSSFNDSFNSTTSTSRDTSERSLCDILDEAISISNELLLHHTIPEIRTKQNCRVERTKTNNIDKPQ